MIRCENCHAVIGDYEITKNGYKKSVLIESAQTMPCCDAEVCADCVKKIDEKGRCLFCGKRAVPVNA